MADESLNQDDIEALLAGASPGPSGPAGRSDEGPADGDQPTLGQDEIEALMAGPSPYDAQEEAPLAGEAYSASGNDVELLLSRAQQAIASLDEPHDDLPEGVQPFRLESFGGTPANTDSATLELVRDVQLDLKIELGRTRMPIEDVLRLRKEAVVTLDKLAGDPVDVYVNGRLIARGEVLVLSDNFCVRVTELIVGDSAVA
ncbi:flagellar motor switch protein FliN [Botrimarina sp.]|uniref:flagellar motor switch protein FliN n=1 Tax=Botrimarina sp. TaxID=2795802 RepID=UPI0032EFD9E7